MVSSVDLSAKVSTSQIGVDDELRPGTSYRSTQTYS